MRSWTAIGSIVATAFLGVVGARSALQTPAVLSVDEKVLHEYAGVYQWEPNAFVYLQMWEEFSGFGKPKLVAFDESGEARTLYPTDRDQFFAGPGIAVPASSHESSFSATAQARSSRSRGSAKKRLHVSRAAPRSRNTKTSSSRVGTFGSRVR